ncbi:YncE family protein, partial [Patescibacteria group bacterium]|nr:YncE family protein [Patescibacteria group bacterium]
AGWSEGKKIFLLRRNYPRLLALDETDFSLNPFLKEESQGDIQFFSSPESVIKDSSRNLIYVANLGNDTVTVIDGKTKKPFKTIPVGAGPLGIDFNPKTGKLYTANRVGNSVTVIDTATYNTKTITVGLIPSYIAVNSETNKIYVSEAGDNKVAVIDGVKEEVIKYISVGAIPQAILANTPKNRVYVSNSGEDTISVIDGAKDEVVNVIKTEKTPRRIELADNKIFVVAEGNNSLIAIDQETEKIIGKVRLKAVPFNIAWDKLQNKLLIIHKGRSMVSIVDPQNYEILSEKEFAPFFSYMDNMYNKFLIDWDEEMVYFTQSTANAVHVVKIEENLSDLSLKLAAIIESNGEVIWQPGFEPLPKEVILFIQTAMKWVKENAFLVGGTIVAFSILIGFIVYRKKHGFESLK